MLNISKSILASDIAYSDFKFISYNIVKDSTYINFDITRENTQTEEVSNLYFKIKISDITNNINFDEQTIWAIDDSFVNGLDEENPVVSPLYLIAVLPKSFILKQNPSEAVNIKNTSFYMFFKTKNIEDLVFRVIQQNPDLEFSGDTGEEIVYSTQNSWKDLFSTISATTEQTTVNVGDDITVNVTCSDDIETVYLEAINAYLPKTRVNIVNKTGSFIIKTDGLNSGDTVSVKLSYKYFTGVTVFSKTLA
jgi:hypothetical protein